MEKRRPVRPSRWKSKAWKIWQGMIGKAQYQIVRLHNDKLEVERWIKGKWMVAHSYETVLVLSTALVQFSDAAVKVQGLLAGVAIGNPD